MGSIPIWASKIKLMKLGAEIIPAYKKCEEIVKDITEINLHIEGNSFVITDFIAKPIEPIFRTTDVDVLYNWLQCFKTAKEIYEFKYKNK